MIPTPVPCDLDRLARNAHEEHERVFDEDVESATRGESAAVEEAVADAPGVGFDAAHGDDVMLGMEQSERPPEYSPSPPPTLNPALRPSDLASPTSVPETSHRGSAQNKRSHARRAKQRGTVEEEMKARGEWTSASKPPKQHVLHKARDPKPIETSFSPAEERAIPAGAGFTAKAAPQTAEDKVPRRLEDFDWSIWRRIAWDGR